MGSSTRVSQLLLLFATLSMTLTGCTRDRASSESAILYNSDEPVVTVASTTQIEIIQASLRDGLRVADAYAVRSEKHDWAHYISARLDGVDSNDVGLWFMFDGMDVPGDRFSVNATARAVSTISPTTDSTVSQTTNRYEIRALLALTEKRRFKVYP